MNFRYGVYFTVKLLQYVSESMLAFNICLRKKHDKHQLTSLGYCNLLDFIYQNTILFYPWRLFVQAKNIVVKEKPLSLHYTFTNTRYDNCMLDLQYKDHVE